MRKMGTAFILTLLAPLEGTSAGVEEDCRNLAYRYCCQHQPDFFVPCPGVFGDYCECIVDEGPNEFGQVLVPPTTGAMTQSSFYRVGELDCEFHPAFCFQQPIPHCQVSQYPVASFCVEHAQKTQFSWCSDEPQG